MVKTGAINMIFLFSMLGLIFLLCCLVFVRFKIDILIDKQEKGLVLKGQVFIYITLVPKHWEFHYENSDSNYFIALENLKLFSEKLEESSHNRGFKAYLVRLGLHDYKKIMQAILNYTVVEKIDWKTNVGLQDAMYTGLAVGSLWTLKGILTSMVSMNSRLEKLNLTISPHFNTNIFISNLHCIIKIRIVNIIFITVYILFLIVRGYFNGYRPGKTESSHRRAYENSYAEY